MLNGLRLLSQLDSQLRSINSVKQRVALVLWPNTFINVLVASPSYDSTIFATSCLLRLIDFFKDGNNQLRSHIVDCISSIMTLMEKKKYPVQVFADITDDVLKKILPIYSSNDPITKCLCLNLIKELATLLANNPLVQYL